MRRCIKFAVEAAFRIFQVSINCLLCERITKPSFFQKVLKRLKITQHRLTFDSKYQAIKSDIHLKNIRLSKSSSSYSHPDEPQQQQCRVWMQNFTKRTLYRCRCTYDVTGGPVVIVTRLYCLWIISMTHIIKVNSKLWDPPDNMYN
jgi:hypothetical protein